MLKHRALFLGLMAVLVAGFALGSEAIPNWAAPATWAPARSGGLHTMTDVTFMLPFIGVTPCRVADTRGNGFVGQYGPPSLVANATRNFTIAGQCGIPSTAQAVSFNFGALNIGGGGDLRVFPAGGGVPLVSTMNYNASTPNIANAAIVPLGAGGAITVQADAVSIDLIIDVNGYYAPIPNGSNNGLLIRNTNGGAVLIGENDSTAASVIATEGIISSTSPGGFSTGVRGINNGTGGSGIGVWGSQGGSGWGVYGTVAGGIAVFGSAAGGTGVVGETSSTSDNAGGVVGNDGAGVAGPGSSFFSSGVVGNGKNGVLGRTSTPVGDGVVGIAENTAGTKTGDGRVGSGTNAFVAVLGGYAGPTPAVTVAPHPTDASVVIAYPSPTGNEAGTYFRGTAQTTNREFVINVPEDFRMVTDPEGLTVQLTPVGASSSMYVVSEDLNQIVVHSSRDVTFHYLVQGVRVGQEAYNPVRDSLEHSIFVPQSPDDKMLSNWPEFIKQRLIANGTYNKDGTINMATAERFGWAKRWREAEEYAKAAAAKKAAERASQQQ